MIRILKTGLLLTVVAGGVSLFGAFAQPARAAALSYVALGDSVAAGAGLPLSTNASAEDQLCGRSPQAYPTLLAADLGATLTNLTCSGAGISKGITGAQTVTRDNTTYTVPSQLDRAFANGAPDVITMTVGANDLSFHVGNTNYTWQDLLRKCYTDTCGTTAQSTGIGLALTRYQVRLGNVLREIKTRSGTSTPPKVYLTEYYYPIASPSCLGSGITQGEANWINYQAYNINKAIRQTVVAAGRVPVWLKGPYSAAYVPISFNGHGLCSTDSWVQGLNDAAPVHPTATGQRAYADALYGAAR